MSAASRPTLRPRARGFTLIEIMVALSIVAILASLAVPAFFESIRKSRRSEAMAALSAVQQAQERRRANTSAYTADLAALGVPARTANGLYNLEINSANASSYVVTATALGSQARDLSCASMRVQVVGANILYGSACSACEMADPLTDPKRCWNRQ
jgi:type IV pilus assembly protein PilE